MAELDFDAWYLREHRRVVSALAAITGRPSVAAEAVDEAFVRACERWDHVRAMASPGGCPPAGAERRSPAPPDSGAVDGGGGGPS